MASQFFWLIVPNDKFMKYQVVVIKTYLLQILLQMGITFQVLRSVFLENCGRKELCNLEFEKK